MIKVRKQRKKLATMTKVRYSTKVKVNSYYVIKTLFISWLKVI